MKYKIAIDLDGVSWNFRTHPSSYAWFKFGYSLATFPKKFRYDMSDFPKNVQEEAKKYLVDEKRMSDVIPVTCLVSVVNDLQDNYEVIFLTTRDPKLKCTSEKLKEIFQKYSCNVPELVYSTDKIKFCEEHSEVTAIVEDCAETLMKVTLNKKIKHIRCFLVINEHTKAYNGFIENHNIPRITKMKCLCDILTNIY